MAQVPVSVVEAQCLADEERSSLSRLQIQSPGNPAPPSPSQLFPAPTTALNHNAALAREDLTFSNFAQSGMRQLICEEMESAAHSPAHRLLALQRLAAQKHSSLKVTKFSKVTSAAQPAARLSKTRPRKTVLDRLVDWLASMLKALDHLVFPSSRPRITAPRITVPKTTAPARRKTSLLDAEHTSITSSTVHQAPEELLLFRKPRS